ncbi:putative serine protease K12H4.7 isoform X2 [Cephus cinctus]|uniref:Serine protease K12H4.7 isoform X2 n=1 Tax=Cephus cinctus TaxID=211228 RepID=A0AAJ7RUQ5_CEPCN|nr:putative serine protease K12H4.7 isoform X2 [Cephus cinctus]
MVRIGPILIMVGGEWEISTSFLETGLMFDLGVAHGALMFYTEHRYYGASRPTKDTSPENMQYLNLEQAMADLAYFIETKKREFGIEKCSVVVFGGSYAGSMAAWARLKYPHLIQGAVASSAPVYAKADFYEYYEVVTQSLYAYNPQCVVDIQEAFRSVEELLAVEDGHGKLKEYFNLCAAPDVTDPDDLAYFMNLLAEKFAGVVQSDRIYQGKTSISRYCDIMTATYLGSPLQRLALLIYDENVCLDANYNNMITAYRNKSWESAAATSMMRQWLFQACTEYGYCQTSNSDKSVFGTLFPLEFFVNLCKNLYGDYYNEDLMNAGIKRTNIMYGGFKPDVTNVVFTNGDVDPWYALSVIEDLNDLSPAILIKGSSHCRDLFSDDSTDSKDLLNARAKVKQLVGNWLNS